MYTISKKSFISKYENIKIISNKYTYEDAQRSEWHFMGHGRIQGWTLSEEELNRKASNKKIQRVCK